MVASRGSKKPQLRAWDRILFLALAHRFSRWREALLLVKPDTLLRWHRHGFRRYMSKARSTPPDGQRWSSFLRQEAAGIWACDFLEVHDLRFRCHYVLIVIHLKTRQILHAASTLAPTVAWTVQQLRDLTPYGSGPKFLLRDNDGKFTAAFDATARGAGADRLGGAGPRGAGVRRPVGLSVTPFAASRRRGSRV